MHSIPGNFFPSINSSDAPPPVEIWDILSAKPALVTAAAESPPPIIVVQSLSSDRHFAIEFVPTANWSNSNNPTGPFHNTVLAFWSSSVYSFIVSGPISKPSHPSGISEYFTTLLSVSGLN